MVGGWVGDLEPLRADRPLHPVSIDRKLPASLARDPMNRPQVTVCQRVLLLSTSSVDKSVHDAVGDGLKPLGIGLQAALAKKSPNKKSFFQSNSYPWNMGIDRERLDKPAVSCKVV